MESAQELPQSMNLANLDIPVRIIWGRQDPVFPLEIAESAVKRIPGADLLVIENCGHMPHLERPDELTGHVRQFPAFRA